jgi:hypothetical protein
MAMRDSAKRNQGLLLRSLPTSTQLPPLLSSSSPLLLSVVGEGKAAIAAAPPPHTHIFVTYTKTS